MTTSALLFSRAARLLKPADFDALRRAPNRLSFDNVRCEFRPNGLTSARLGMAVSRRVSKRAVVRNRIRRQIRESFRLRRTGLPAYDILVIARTNAATQTSATLLRELNRLWTKLERTQSEPMVAALRH